MADGQAKKKKNHTKRVVRKPNKPARHKQTSPHVFSMAKLETIRDMSTRLSVPASRLEVTIAAALLEKDLFQSLSQLIEVLLHGKTSPKLSRMALDALVTALEANTIPEEDPLAQVDRSKHEKVTHGFFEAELASRKRREDLLAHCVGAEEAARITGATRQNIERLRKQKKVIAIRVGARWRYPSWQFDPDYPSGVIPGIAETLGHLHLSPSGTAAWLLTPLATLRQQTPIELLRRGEVNPVIDLAEDHGHAP